MYEVIFLWILALIWISFAVIQDIRTREIANWLSFSLIIFALGYRLFYSLFNWNFNFFLQGLIGFGVFFVIGNLFYYGRVFAGGDAKLMIAFGAVLPYSDFYSNLTLYFNFLVIFLSTGFAYVILTSLFLCIKNFSSFRKEFIRQSLKNKKFIFAGLIFGIILSGFGFIDRIFFAFGALLFGGLILYLYSKSVDEVCMVRKVKTKYLREGDWLYSDIKIGKNLVKAKWDGLSKYEISKIRKKYDSVKIRYGVPFSPVFLISFLIVAILVFLNIELWQPFW